MDTSLRQADAPVESTDVAPPAAPGFLSSQPKRAGAESVVVRVVATAGVVGIATGVGAILGANNVDPWVLALIVSILSVILAAILWRSRRL